MANSVQIQQNTSKTAGLAMDYLVLSSSEIGYKLIISHCCVHSDLNYGLITEGLSVCAHRKERKKRKKIPWV